MASQRKPAPAHRNRRCIDALSRTGLSLSIITGAYLAAPLDAFAYLDPGTGSFVLQALVASVMGAVFVTKTYWAKIKAYFKGESPDEENDAQAQAERGDD